MAPTGKLYGPAMGHAFAARINFTSDTMKCALLTSAYTFDATAQDTHDYFDDVTAYQVAIVSTTLSSASIAGATSVSVAASVAVGNFVNVDGEIRKVTAVSGAGPYTLTLATGGDSVKPLEQDLMAMLHTEQRFVDFGCRSQINYPGVALLVKNMPLDNRARYGRLKDTLPFVLGACDAKLRMLDAEHALMLQNRDLSNSVLSVQRTLSEVSQLLVKNQRAIGAVMSELTTELSLHMNKLGLEGDQEEFIHHKVDLASNKLFTCVREGNVVENILSGIVDLLRQMSTEQARIISETLSTQIDGNQEPITSDVELF